jgi:cell division protein FtsQ
VTARVARGNSARANAKPRGRSVNTRRPKKTGMLEEIGLASGMGRRLGGWIFAGLAIAAIIAALLVFRVPQLIGTTLSEGVGQAGFTMSRVEIRGARRVSRLEVYNIAFDQASTAMPSVDLAATRARLLEFGWVKEARVSRRLPDTLVIDIVERQPVAIWQNNQQLSLIDAEGVVLEPVRIEAMPDLLRVLGAGANRNLGTLNALLEAAPHLRPQVDNAAWVGGRRWDLRFQTGETLSLPEGDDAARRAITRFAGMDQQTQLLGRGFVRFDMRDPRRMVVRVSREPGSSIPTLSAEPPRPGAQGAAEDLSETI